MARHAKPIDVADVHRLPSFPSESWDVTVELLDDTDEVIKTMARGPVASIQTALHIVSRWPEEKIKLVVALWTARAS